jgi:hypothetical protein
MTACTFALDPINALDKAFSFADTNVGTLRVVNGAPSGGATLYAIRVTYPDNSLREFWFETGLLPGASREYSFPAGEGYKVRFNNGQGWTRDPQTVSIVKDQTAIVNFTGNEEISIDLSGVKGKLTVYNLIPKDAGDYVIENLRVSSEEESSKRETVVFYFYTANGIRNGENQEFDVLAGKYWVRAQIRHPTSGKLSKWSIPAYVRTYTSADNYTDSNGPAIVEVKDNTRGIAIFNAGVLDSDGNVDIGGTHEKPTYPDYPPPKDNDSMDENGREIPNVDGTVSSDSSPVKAIKVEKLGFTPPDDYTGDGLGYAYAQKDDVLAALNVKEGETVPKAKVVRTTIYDQTVQPGGAWHLSLAEEGWYLLSFSVDGKAFSKGYPIRLSKVGDNWVVEPGVIPPFDDDGSVWKDKDGVIISNETPENGGPIIKNGETIGTLSPEDAKKPITDIKIYDENGELYAHYRNRYGLPIYNGKDWIITPALPGGTDGKDYYVTFSDDYGKTWTHPPILLHVDGNGNGNFSYDKTHPQWDGTSAGKPAPETTSPDLWGNDPDVKSEVNPRNPIYVVVPSDPPLDTVPPAGIPAGSEGPKELVNVTGDIENDTTPPAYGSQLDIINRSTKVPPFVIKYIKLNASSTPRVAYRIIDLTRITYSGGGGGIPAGKRLSLVGFDLKPDNYWVYLSEDGRDWKRYKETVAIPAPWKKVGDNIVFTGTTAESKALVPKVIYRDDAGGKDDWNTNPPPSTGILLIRNTSNKFITNLTIKAGSSFLTHEGVTYDGAQTFANIAPNATMLIELPVTNVPLPDTPYLVGIGTSKDQAVEYVYYRATITQNGITYLTFTGTESGGKTPDTPIVIVPVDPDDPGGGTDPDDPGGGPTPPYASTGILMIRNFSDQIIDDLTIRSGSTYFTYGGVEYNAARANIPIGGTKYFEIPSEDSPYTVIIQDTSGSPQGAVYYRVIIEQNKPTYLTFYGTELGEGKGTTPDTPIVLDPNTYPGNGETPTVDPPVDPPSNPDAIGILTVRNLSDQAITSLTIKKYDNTPLTYLGVTYNGSQPTNIPIDGELSYTIPVTGSGAYTVIIQDTAGSPTGPVHYRVIIFENRSTYLSFYGTELGEGKGTSDNPISLDPDTYPGNGHSDDGGGGEEPPDTPPPGGGDDGGNTGGVKTGILIVQNPTYEKLVNITIKVPYSNGTIVEYAGITYDARPLPIPARVDTTVNYEAFALPVTTEDTDLPGYNNHLNANLANSYLVRVVGEVANGASTLTCYYRVAIAEGKTTYISFLEGHLCLNVGAERYGKPFVGASSESDPYILNPFEEPGNAPYRNYNDSTPPPPPPPDDRPPTPDGDITVIGGGSGSSGGLMQPVDGTPAFDVQTGTFDRSLSSDQDRLYDSGLVQPYIPYLPASSPYPYGGDGTKQNMNNRGYFNFRFHWRADTNWGIGALSLQRLQRQGTSSTKVPVGDVIYLLNAKADYTNTTDRKTGSSQARLGAIYTSTGTIGDGIGGSIKGEDRSFEDWQRNWLGLREPNTGWQLNISPPSGNVLNVNQPVYRSGKGYYSNRTAQWKGSSDNAANREYSAHRAVNNPGRLYTTGVIYKAPASSAITADPYVFDHAYANLGEGFEAGEYRVYLRKGYDSLHKTADVGDAHQIKMYRYYLESFDITIYPGVVTTAIYRDGLKSTEGAFSYTPIPQAAYGKLVVLNAAKPADDYRITAILLDKPGYYSSTSTSSRHEVHRYLAALSSGGSLTGGTPNLLNGYAWGQMNPIARGGMHTFVLPPGGYRIAVKSTRNTSYWYGSSASDWFPVVVGEGETVYLNYQDTKLVR